ncbi:MAG: serine acetyltransferase [Muribaculaceae bacterium]|nr:serine acetyltransferase [Muribaculaceae bacterium]
MSAINSDITEALSYTVMQLSDVSKSEKQVYSEIGHVLPSVVTINEIIMTLKQLLFPEFFYASHSSEAMRQYHIGVGVDRLFTMLRKQISAGLHFALGNFCDDAVVADAASEKAAQAVAELPELKRRLYTDIRAVFNNDPAVSNEEEVIFCYPSVKAMLHYRFAHLLHSLEVPLLPRIITEIAHSETGIDIHPGASIGEYFSIDHGTGVVIGETCVIGRNVAIYQGVTLGAKNFSLDSEGHPVNIPRHPIIEDNVTIYSNASVLGRVTIGHDTTIGGNVWVTHSVPPYSRVLQGQMRSETFVDGAGI